MALRRIVSVVLGEVETAALELLSRRFRTTQPPRSRTFRAGVWRALGVPWPQALELGAAPHDRVSDLPETLPVTLRAELQALADEEALLPRRVVAAAGGER